MTAQVPNSARRSVYGAPADGKPSSIATVIWHRFALLVIAILSILVILPALLSAAGSQLTAVA